MMEQLNQNSSHYNETIHLKDEAHSLFHRSSAVVTFAIISLSLLYLFYRIQKTPQKLFWKAHPMSGARPELFWWPRLVVRSFFQSQVIVDQGYKKFSSKNRIFGAPSVDRGAFIVVPPNQLRPIYDLPETEVDAHWTQSESIQAKYTIGDPEVFTNAFHVNVIRNQITRNLEALTGDIVEELSVGFREHWGVDQTEWKQVLAWSSCLQIVAKAVNRVFVGTPHCRNEEFLRGTKSHAEWVFSTAFVIHSIPWFLRPLVGNLAWLYGKRVRSRCLRPMLPLIKQRLEDFLQQQQTPSTGHQPPSDGLQWLLEEAYKTGNRKYLDPVRIGHRLLILNFVSMHTTSFTITNALQDLFSQNPDIGTVADLREECERVLDAAGGTWTKDAISKLHLTDSVIRESMRVSSFSVLALPRHVTAKNGITINDGVHIPKGIYLATPMDAIHHDPNFYPDPETFHPFRFCRPSVVEGTRTNNFYSARNMHAAMCPPEVGDTFAKPKSTVTLDEKFLSFGFGRNACPGRFFALHEIKLMLAHIVLNYDIQYFETRPEQLKIMWVQLPREGTRFTVRKKSSATGV